MLSEVPVAYDRTDLFSKAHQRTLKARCCHRHLIQESLPSHRVIWAGQLKRRVLGTSLPAQIARYAKYPLLDSVPPSAQSMPEGLAQLIMIVHGLSSAEQVSSADYQNRVSRNTLRSLANPRGVIEASAFSDLAHHVQWPQAPLTSPSAF